MSKRKNGMLCWLGVWSSGDLVSIAPKASGLIQHEPNESWFSPEGDHAALCTSQVRRAMDRRVPKGKKALVRVNITVLEILDD